MSGLVEISLRKGKNMSDNKTQGKTGVGKVLLIVILIVGGVIFIRHLGEIDDAKHIEAVLAQDKALGDTLNGRMRDVKGDSEEDFDRIAGYFDDFVERERGIDTRDCPREFADSYSRYVSAFAEEATVLRAHPHIPSGDEAFVLGFIKGLKGDPTGEMREISDSLNGWKNRWHENADRATQAEQEMRAIAVRYERYAWPRFD